MSEEPVRLRLPMFFLPEQEHWRSRLDELRADFATVGPLAMEIRGIRAVSDTHGDLAAQNACRAFVERHRDLFPGVDGEELAWAIVCDAYPQRIRARRLQGVPLWDCPEVELFSDPVPPYRRPMAQSVARKSRRDDETRDLLAMLQDHLVPEQIAARTGKSVKEVHDWISRLRRKRHVNIPPSDHLHFYAMFSSAIALVEADDVQADDDMTQRIPVSQVQQRTGLSLSELMNRDARVRVVTVHCTGETRQMVDIPGELIAARKPESRLEGPTLGKPEG